MSPKVKGTIYGIVSAISYGMNPLGALSLYKEGVNANSVLFYRFFLAAIILGGIMLIQKKSFKITLKELSVLASLGILFGISSLSLFTSFHYMDAGIASTILFVYPIMVAVIMSVFFKEKISTTTALSILLALGGIILLYQNDGGTTLSTIGVILVMVSSLSYAVYIVVVNQSSLIMSSIKLTFYVLLFCILTITIHSTFNVNNHIQLLHTPSMWMWAGMLALIPTIISLIMMVNAVHAIGSTPTAIMGALEPLTAVIIGVTIFGELFTTRLATGILLILCGVILIIAGKTIHPKIIITRISHTKHTLQQYINGSKIIHLQKRK